MLAEQCMVSVASQEGGLLERITTGGEHPPVNLLTGRRVSV
jgi:hypothetical protein